MDGLESAFGWEAFSSFTRYDWLKVFVFSEVEFLDMGCICQMLQGSFLDSGTCDIGG